MSNQDIYQRQRAISDERKASEEFNKKHNEEMKKNKKKQSQSTIYTITKGICCAFVLSVGMLIGFKMFYGYVDNQALTGANQSRQHQLMAERLSQQEIERLSGSS